MLKIALSLALMGAACGVAAGQAAVRVEPPSLNGPRALANQTANAVVKDYIQAWESLRAALDDNRPELLDRDFVGDARDKLAAAIQDQSKAGLKTSYQDQSHDVRIVFYSPEGLSIELTDDVEYEMQVKDQDKVVASQTVHQRYVVVMTPTEVSWRVRVMQAAPE